MRAVYGFSCVALLGCMSNFDVFLPRDGAVGDAPIGDGAGFDAGKPCDASPACLAPVAPCASACRDASAACQTACGNPGCKKNCMATEQACIDDCVNKCVGCTADAGCAAQSACQNAAN